MKSSTESKDAKLAVGLCGLTKSGKDHVASLLSRPIYGKFRVFNLTELVLSPIALVRGLPADRDSLRRLLTKLDNTANEMLFLQAIARGANRVVLPNVRMLSTIEFWKRKSGYKFYLIKVNATDETRYNRYLTMARSIDPKVNSIERFRREIDCRDLDVNELDLIFHRRKFDFVIENNDGGDLHSQLDDFTKRILGL